MGSPSGGHTPEAIDLFSSSHQLTVFLIVVFLTQCSSLLLKQGWHQVSVLAYEAPWLENTHNLPLHIWQHSKHNHTDYHIQRPENSESGTLDTSATDNNNNRDQGENATQLGPEDWHLHPSSPISYQSYNIVFSFKDKGLFIIFIVHLSTHLPSTYPPHHPLKTLCWELTVYQTPSRASSLAEKKTSKLILRITCDQCWCVSAQAQ